MHVRQLMMKKRTGRATMTRERVVDTLKEIDIAPTIIRKMVPGPRMAEISITT